MIFVIIILLILFVHIKIKFKIEYIDKNLKIYIYNFKIPLKQKNKSKKNSTQEYIVNNTEKKEEKKKKNSKLQTIINKVKIKPLKLVDLLINNKYKPKLIINKSLKYSLEDAALTAEFFGGLNIALQMISSIINLFLKFKPTFNIEPTFSNKNYFDIKLNGILSVNLAQIIFILFILIKSLDIKGGNPKGKNYGK